MGSTFGIFELMNNIKNKPNPITPIQSQLSQPRNVRIFTRIDDANQYKWILSWQPVFGSLPITYYYTITTTDGQIFMQGSTTSTFIELINTRNNTTYHVSLYAQNKFGKSSTLQQNVTTLGPPIINRSSLYNIVDENAGTVIIQGSTNAEISATETNLQFDNQYYTNNLCAGRGTNSFACGFDVQNILPGQEMVFNANIYNKYGNSILYPPYYINIPGNPPAQPSSVELNY
ncbi:Hypothetical protein KVN_LOCUS68 [uncultured virus]|nr:Hypothetical protein KVN_LOCUS68 [uncultured virus]